MSIIVVVMPKPEDAKKIRKILISHGFPRVSACQTASAVLMETAEHQKGLVISGYKLPDMYYRDLAQCLPRNFSLILIGSARLISQEETGILSLTTPLKVYDLVNTVEMVMRQLERRAKLEKKSHKKRSEREENYIRNAKALLMERNHLTEEEAHRYIQKCSMDNGTNMAETAQMILTLMFDEV